MSPYARRALEAPTLSAEQERELLLRCRGGDPRAREALIEAGLRWVVLHALRRRVEPEHFDDAVQDGTAALIRAVDRFDPARGTRLVSFAWSWIDGAMRQPPRPLLLPLGDVPEPATTDPDALHDALDTLSELDARLLRDRFGLDDGTVPSTRPEVAARLGLSIAEVRRRETRALQQLRREWAAPVVGSPGPDC
ncbi:sigma factor [Aeromicrobium piscarium]|nr:sigma factor [Aeromicrobium piscarium]